MEDEYNESALMAKRFLLFVAFLLPALFLIFLGENEEFLENVQLREWGWIFFVFSGGILAFWVELDYRLKGINRWELAKQNERDVKYILCQIFNCEFVFGLKRFDRIDLTIIGIVLAIGLAILLVEMETSFPTDEFREKIGLKKSRKKSGNSDKDIVK